MCKLFRQLFLKKTANMACKQYNQSADISTQLDEIISIDGNALPQGTTAIQGTNEFFVGHKANGQLVIMCLNDNPNAAQRVIVLKDAVTLIPYTVVTNFWGWRP